MEGGGGAERPLKTAAAMLVHPGYLYAPTLSTVPVLLHLKSKADGKETSCVHLGSGGGVSFYEG